MDVNKTRFHMLLGRGDWAPLLNRHLDWDKETGAVTLNGLMFRFQPMAGSADLALKRRGAACDQFGNWYWIDEGGTEIRRLSPGRRESWHWFSMADLAPGHGAGSGAGSGAAPLQGAGADPGEFHPDQPPPPPPTVEFQGLAVTDDHYLVVGMLAPAGLLVFDLHAGGHPVWLLWPDGVPFAPYDMAPRPGGGVWVLDQVNRKYWGLDRHFRISGEAADGAFPSGFPVRMKTSRSFQLAAIEALPDGTVLIMDWRRANPSDTDRSRRLARRPPKIYRYRLAERVQILRFAIPQDQLSPPGSRFILRGYDFAFVPRPSAAAGQIDGLLMIAGADGDQAFAFELKGPDAGPLSLEVQERYFPMRGFGGRGLVRSGESVCYDYQDQWVPLAEQPRYRYEEVGQLVIRQAGRTPGPLDSRKPDCVWHRVMLDACIPPGAAVTVESRAANLEADLADDSIPWQTEPAPYLRTGGSELPYHRPFPEDEPPPGAGTWELLLQRARGRFLQLRLTLRGNQRVTPRIIALRVYYDRFSYLLQYLPDLYQDERQPADFLERFLANPEGLYSALEGRIAQAQMLFDVTTVPMEYLDWLAGWLGLAMEAKWQEDRKRRFLRAAPALFRQRGTPDGLVRAVALATDAAVRLVEGRSPHRFTVLVPARSYGNSRAAAVDPALVERVVELEKPAHTAYEVKEYWAMFRVGEAHLGSETQLDQGSRLTAAVLGDAWLAQSYLSYPHPWNVTNRMVVGRDRVARPETP